MCAHSRRTLLDASFFPLGEGKMRTNARLLFRRPDPLVFVLESFESLPSCLTIFLVETLLVLEFFDLELEFRQLILLHFDERVDLLHFLIVGEQRIRLFLPFAFTLIMFVLQRREDAYKTK
jgi:hypothetical protein